MVEVGYVRCKFVWKHCYCNKHDNDISDKGTWHGIATTFNGFPNYCTQSPYFNSSLITSPM